MKRFALTSILALLAHLALLAVPYSLPSPPVEPPTLRLVLNRPVKPEPPAQQEENSKKPMAPTPSSAQPPPVLPRVESSKPSPTVPKVEPVKVVRKKRSEPPKPLPKPKPVKNPEPEPLQKAVEPEPEPAEVTPAEVAEMAVEKIPQPGATPAEKVDTLSTEIQARSEKDALPKASDLRTGPIEASFGDLYGPRILRKVAPKYPSTSKRRGEEGTVLLLLAINEEGGLTSAEVLESAGDRLDKAALAAVWKAKYAPATCDGKPVACLAKLPIRFRLRASL